jgi:tetratricopeptide (TPR) repeat protein
VPQYRSELATSCNNFGALLVSTDQRPEAEQMFLRAIELRAKLAADYPGVPAYRQDHGRSQLNLGVLLAAMGQKPAAERAYHQAIDIQVKLADEFHERPDYRWDAAASYCNLGILLAEMSKRVEAEQAYQRAIAFQEELAKSFPSATGYRLELAASCVNLGHLLRDGGEVEASLAWFAKGITVLDLLVQKEPRLETGRLFLRNAHWGRAEALQQLGRHGEAAKDWDRALAMNSQPAVEIDLRRNRADALVRAGDHAAATAEADALVKLPMAPADLALSMARVFALAAASATADTSLADQYATRAIDLLRRGQTAGHFQNPAQVEKLRSDPDFKSLRLRADFVQLLEGLGRASKPPPN